MGDRGEETPYTNTPLKPLQLLLRGGATGYEKKNPRTQNWQKYSYL